ncbi:SDR family oxidoreductase [Vibrio salinus]|uniref:SDR family oxidoreductase n=1 Tax=Vibrio salinus TaxID=2899784 RepID=UPI001E31291C|nr:SDR family oxidoreductase [Vibrio salinus]MCE0495442.1 SDR family oxidoreductase [Vibrio salinus]
MKRILLAGATGYLGGYIAKELQHRSCFFRAIARNPEKLEKNNIKANEILKAELTDPDSIKECCKGIDIVISTVGITKQKDGLTYMDVDFQANMNLLKEAQKSGVKKFIYVSVLNGEKLRHLKICDAKELFVEQLKQSGIDYCIVRPNGFFSDMSEFFNMAKKGKIYLFGKGKFKANPIHGEDLATFCVDVIDKPDKEVEIGGPETLTQNEIASIAFDILGRKRNIIYIPEVVRVAILKLVKLFTGSKFYGPVEFFMTVMSIDMIAPEYGKHTLKEYFIKSNNPNA